MPPWLETILGIVGFIAIWIIGMWLYGLVRKNWRDETKGKWPHDWY